ncbi:DsrE family protein [Glaciecola sp. 1036]|uniref:DsrE family protein n=1 Tax=Alteromonadaceae TaxID=72275 RepID=UPI003CFBE821
MKHISAALLILLSFSIHAEDTPPAIKDFGYFYEVPDHVPIDENTKFKIAFDVAKGAESGKQNNNINSLARFINMHLAHGVKAQNIQLALVVHGGATLDVLSNDEFKKRFEVDNGSESLITQLLENNTQVFVCGQSAMHNKVEQSQLIPGVQMALSAMTAHAILQQQGYTLNPF